MTFDNSLCCLRTVDSAFRAALQLTLVERLACGGVKELEKTAFFAETGDARAITAVSARVEDANENVRRAAVRALKEIAGKGNAGAITAVLKGLEHEDKHVRIAAVVALPQIAEKGNADAITKVSACLQDPEEDVRLAAVKALARIAEKGNVCAIAAVLERMEDPSHLQGRVEVQKAAVDSLFQIAEN